jgi:predicted Zn-dependent protease with MMP-like domain
LFEIKQYPEEVEKLGEELISYVTEARLDNVISKVGQVTENDCQMLIGLFSKDALEDFMKDNATQYNALVTEHQKYLTKKLANNSVRIVKLYFRKNT